MIPERTLERDTPQDPDGRSIDLAAPVRDRSSEQARWIGRPDMLTAAQFSERFRLALTTIDHRRRAWQLLGLRPEATRKTLRYPAWQGKMIAEPASRQLFESILQSLGPAGAWRAYEFFTSPSPVLSGRTPIEAWRMESRELLLQAAQAWRATGAPG
jgi:hypothetical protein